jgi:hypothetical protein
VSDGLSEGGPIVDTLQAIAADSAGDAEQDVAAGGIEAGGQLASSAGARRSRRGRARATASRRLRQLAAGWLHRAEHRLRAGELEADRL